MKFAPGNNHWKRSGTQFRPGHGGTGLRFGDPARVAKVRLVHCVDCAAQMKRTHHFRGNPRCAKCQEKQHKLKRSINVSKIRSEARRFRLICHYLGWEPEQFEEMIEEMKKSPMAFRDKPENRQARLDETMERKARAAREAARRKRWAEEARDESAGIGRLA